MQTISRLKGGRNITDESLERSTLAKDTEQHIATIDLGESPARKLEIAVGNRLRQSLYNNNVACARIVDAADNLYPSSGI